MEYGSSMGLEYWLQWQVGACALLIFISAAVTLRYLLGLGQIEPNRILKSGELWIPCWSWLNPRWLMIYRAFAFASTAFILYEVVVELRGPIAFYFYTQWTFTLVMIYFALATLLSARECWAYSNKQILENGVTGHLLKKGSESNKCTNNLEEIEEKAGFLGHLIQAIYQTSAGASMLTDLVFWCLLYPLVLPKDFKMNFTIWCTHSLNAIFLILDSALNSQPFQWHGFAYFVLWSVSYITFQWILHACGMTWWPYPFLDLSTPNAPLWYFGMALIHIPCFGVYFLLIKGKDYFFSKMFPQAFVRTRTTSERKSLNKKQT